MSRVVEALEVELKAPSPAFLIPTTTLCPRLMLSASEMAVYSSWDNRTKYRGMERSLIPECTKHLDGKQHQRAKLSLLLQERSL